MGGAEHEVRLSELWILRDRFLVERHDFQILAAQRQIQRLALRLAPTRGRRLGDTGLQHEGQSDDEDEALHMFENYTNVASRPSH